MPGAQVREADEDELIPMHELIEVVAHEQGLPIEDERTRLKMLLDLARLAHHTHTPYPEIKRLAGKNILDIACGQDAAEDPAFRPWFCHLAHQLGCQVTGVDLPGGVTHAPWTFEGMDLADPRCLFEFPDDSFDVVHSTYFILNDNPDQDDCPEFRSQFGDDLRRYACAQQGIVWQMQRIVKPCGVVILNDRSFTKDGRPNR